MMNTPPKLRLENQICHSLYSATNALVRAYRPLLEELGLTYPQYLVLLSLWENDGVTVKQIASHTRFDSGTLTPMLKRLEQKKLISRLRSDEDERQRTIVLTREGADLAKRAEAVPDALICKIDMSREEAVALKQLAEKLYQQVT